MLRKSVLRIALSCIFMSVWLTAAFARDAMGEAKALFLQGKYWQAIHECTDVINKNPDNKDLLSEANYFAGASYVNFFDFLTAKKCFRAVVDKYKGSEYYEDAYLGLGDVEFLQENLEAAKKVYNEFLASGPSRKRLATLYFRLAELNFKEGDREEYNKYLHKLEVEFPESFEARDAKRLLEEDDFYTVQVGAFVNYKNAQKCMDELKARGYDVYSALCMLSGKKLCRIRVGKLQSYRDAQELKKRLEIDGYFAKIFPQPD